MTKINETQIKNRIREFRIKKGITLYQLANEVGISDAALSKIEKNINGCQLRTAVAISKALSINFNDLFIWM